MATPSLAMVPSGYKDGKLYNVLPNNAGGDFDVTRGSLATRVNKDGLIEPVGTLGADVILNGDFEETGADQILNGDFSQESSELIVNGDFATDTDWTKATGWTISGGSANTNGTTGSDIKQDNTTVVGKSYKYSFTVSNSGIGVIDGRYRNGSGGTILNFSAEGTYEGYFTAYDTFANFVNLSGNTASYSIDNVSVVEVGQNWSLGDKWSIIDNAARLVSADSVASPLTQLSAFTIGKTYKVTFDAEVVSGEAKLEGSGGSNLLAINATKSYSIYIVADSTTLTFNRQSVTSDITITNITVEEVGQEWTLTDGVSITAQGARITSDGTYQDIEQTNALVIGDTYEMEYEITESISGLIKVDSSFGSGYTLKTTVGVHKFYAVATNTFLQIKRSGGVTDITIDNIIIKRLNGDDTPRIDYTDGGCPVLLTEPQSTNLIEDSSDFSQWQLVNIATEVSNTLSPNGTSFMTKATFSNSGISSYVRQNLTMNVGSITASIFVKKGLTDSYAQITIGGIDNEITVWFDLDNGIVSSSIGSPTSTSIIDYGNGIYRISATTTSTTDLTLRAVIQSANSDGGVPTENATQFYWGGQAEELSYSTSYIPTYGAVRTRLQDSVLGAGTASDFNSTEGVLFAEIQGLTDGGANRFISLSDGTAINAVSIYINTIVGAISVEIRSSGSPTEYLSYLSAEQTNMNKIAVLYKNNDYQLWVNGVKVAFNTNALTPIALNNLNLSTSTGVDNLYGKTSQIQVFKTALTDAELQTLTTI